MRSTTLTTRTFSWGSHSRNSITAQVMQLAKETLANVTASEISRMWPEVLAGILPRVYPEMLAEVYRHQDAGRKTYIVSAAGADMVESLATVLGMDVGGAFQRRP